MKYKLPRTGNAPLGFEGEELAKEEGRWYAGQEQNRYHNLTLYRTTGGVYVLAIEYCTQWQGEAGVEEVITFEEVRDVVVHLQDFDPCHSLAGYPPREHFQEKQERLRQSLKVRFHMQVRNLLANVEGTEEIIE